MRTGISASHEEHGDVTATDGERGDPDDVSHNDAPPGYANMEETLSGAV